MTEEQIGLVGREFRHFKGNLYRLEGFAKDSETLEEMVALEVCRRLTRRFTTDEESKIDYHPIER